MSKPKDIVILMPVFDDWDSVFILLAQLDGVLKEAGLKASIIVVDDGSPVFADSLNFSTLKLSAIKAVEIVTLTRNMGNQRALAIGIGHIAATRDCAALVVMDSDLEDPPKYVPQLIAEAIKGGNEIVFAERTERSEGAAFKAFYGVYQSLYKMLTGLPISFGNFSAVPGRLVKRLAGISEIWSHYPAGIMRAKVPFRAIPTARGLRVKGTSKMNIVSLVIHGISGLSVHADVVGVRLLLGILGLGAAIVTVITVIILQKLLTDIHMLGWTSQIVLVLGSILFQMLIAALLIIFLVLAQKNQRTIIPAVDFEKFILDIKRVYPQ
ncbi:MAG: glycosyltransferase [Proteobacteria bacterium]|nr:glycosyltransferase [Pseudomonadota bacterium]